MIYVRSPVQGLLVRKMNRFLAQVTVDGRRHDAHIPNSGRLTELMKPDHKIILEKADNPERKTRFTLKSVRYKGRWVCIDSTFPNALAYKLALDGRLPGLSGYTGVRREHSIGRHRFDLLLDGPGQKPGIVEVKSVTLVVDGVAMFPDAPTVRGTSHLNALSAMDGDDYARMVLFIIQRSDGKLFRPNRGTDPEFADALRKADDAGVLIRALRCSVGERSQKVLGPVEVEL